MIVGGGWGLVQRRGRNKIQLPWECGKCVDKVGEKIQLKIYCLDIFSHLFFPLFWERILVLVPLTFELVYDYWCYFDEYFNKL